MLAHIEARNTGTMACMQMNKDQIKPTDTNARTTNGYGKKGKKKNMKKYDRLIKVVFFSWLI